VEGREFVRRGGCAWGGVGGGGVGVGVGTFRVGQNRNYIYIYHIRPYIW